MEIELKFFVPDRATFDRLSQLRELAGLRLELGGVKQVHDCYLDTDDRVIMRAGYACRVRRVPGAGQRDVEGNGPELLGGETLIATLKGLGGADADSGIHQRAEYEVLVDQLDPTSWPESRARDIVLQLTGDRSLRELFSLSQERHIRLLHKDTPGNVRQVAELSLDIVTTGGPEPVLYHELEIELLEGGRESDLHDLSNDLKVNWGLEPETRSKFERGLALIEKVVPGDRWERPMREPLTPEEQSVLCEWTEVGNRPEQRRAHIVLLHDEGVSTRAIAAQVGLSRRQVRRWICRFRDKRMGIFPERAEKVDEVIPGEPIQVSEPAGQSELAEALPVTVDELCARNGVDMNRSDYVRGLALQLFDLTADVHGLAPDRRSLLEAAATLYNLASAQDGAQRHLVGRDLILAQPIVGFEQMERDMLAVIVAFHRKKVRRRREGALVRLPLDRQQETLALAALLRMAVGLDTSGTKSTTIVRVDLHDKRRITVVEGPAAEKDAAAALRRSNLWRRLFKVGLGFMTEEQLTRTSLLIKFGLETVSLPELDSPGLMPDDPMSEAGRKMLWFHFLRMLKHESGTRVGEDIEELHDMRVATRRMRAAIRVFGDFFEPAVIQRFNKGIRQVTRALGPVRDLDVFEEKAGRYLKTLPEQARRGLDPLIENWHAEREMAREKMLTFLDSDRYHKFKRDFAGFLQTEGAGARPIPKGRPVPYQVRHVAPRLIYTRYETVRAYETVLEDAQIETLHALRIDCKYLRYTLEFLREVLGPEGEAVISEVKAMQDHLGDLNDAEVAISLLSEFLQSWDVSQADVPLSQRRSGEGLVTYLASRHAEKHRLLITFPEAWARLNREEVRRWMALGVAAL